MASLISAQPDHGVLHITEKEYLTVGTPVIFCQIEDGKITEWTLAQVVKEPTESVFQRGDWFVRVKIFTNPKMSEDGKQIVSEVFREETRSLNDYGIFPNPATKLYEADKFIQALA